MFTCFLAAILLCLADASRTPAQPWEAPLRDSLHAYVARGDLRTADSLVRSHAQEMSASDAKDDFATVALLFITGDPDSVLSLAAGDGLTVRPSSRDIDLGLVLGYEKEEISRKIDSAFGSTEAAAVLGLLMRSMADFAAEGRTDIYSDPDWFYTWKISPAGKRTNNRVLEHLAAYGNGPYSWTLSEYVYFRIQRYKWPVGFNILEGGGWMDGRDAGPIWWRSTSFLWEYRLKKGFAYLKYGRAVGGLGLAYSPLDTRRFVLSPYAGIAQYPFSASGEYKDTRQYSGPDLGLVFDWKFKKWQPPRALLNLYLRANAGVVMDPERLSGDLLRTSFLYLNVGVGINLDVFARYTPYARNGRVKFRRELNWY